MIIQHNMLAQSSNRQLGRTTKKKAGTSEKLATGYRINRAADDAAGLSISEKMRGQIRGLHQASKNVEDGIGLFQVADGAMQEISGMIHRMRELCVQAANDTYTDIDRQMIQKEADELCMEIDRMSEETEFNTLKLLNNSWGHATDGIIGLAKLVGKGNITANGYLSEKISTGNVLDFANGATNATSDVNRTVMTTHTYLTASNTTVTYNGFRVGNNAYTGGLFERNAAGNYVQIGTASNGAVAGALSNNNVLTDHGVTTPTSNVTLNTWSSNKTNSYTYTTPSTGSAAAATAFNRTTNSQTNNGGGTVYGRDASGNYVQLTYTKNTAVATSGSEYFDFADANETLANIKIDFKNFNKGGFTVASLYGTGFNSTCATCNNHYSVKFVSGTGTNLTSKSDSAGNHRTLEIGVDSLDSKSTGEDLAKLIVDSIKANSSFASHFTQYAYKGSTLYAFDNRTSVVGGSARNATYDAGVYGEEASDDKRYPFNIQAGANARQMITCYLPWVSCEQMGIPVVNLMSTVAATKELDNVDNALDYLNSERTKVGAYVNRLEHAKSVDDISEENLQHAESKLRDADISKEMVDYSISNILAQSAQIMLAQANVSKEGILQLLQ